MVNKRRFNTVTSTGSGLLKFDRNIGYTDTESNSTLSFVRYVIVAVADGDESSIHQATDCFPLIVSYFYLHHHNGFNKWVVVGALSATCPNIFRIVYSAFLVQIKYRIKLV